MRKLECTPVRSGRFNAPDPVYSAMLQPQKWNRYSYVLNNPLLYLDRNGQNPCRVGSNGVYHCEASPPPGDGLFLTWLLRELGDLASSTTLVSGGDELVPTASYRPPPRVEATVQAILLGAAIAVGRKNPAKTATAATRVSNIAANRNAGKSVGEAALKELVGGTPQRYFPTPKGGRFIDQFADRIAHEAKTGYTYLSEDVATQISKDVWLRETGRVDDVVWHFYRSGTTGEIGPSGPLRNALDNVNIKWIIHED